jgi:hypothetical protein
MKESVAITKEADAKRGFSPTRSDKSVQYVRDAHERQLGSLRGVIGNIRRDGGKPSVDSIATELSNMPATGERASVLLALQRTHGNRYVQRVFSAARSSHAGEPAPRRTIDMLQEGEEVPERSSSIDEEAAAPPAAAPAPAPAAAPAAASAVPQNLIQILTGWTPGPNRYGFQLRFNMQSSTGNPGDLLRTPPIRFRERVTYSQNDFAARITPSNPTILPPGGMPLTAANTAIAGRYLKLTRARDTHWFPAADAPLSDFLPSPPNPGLPARMISQQLYHYSLDSGASWRYLAGAFIIRRILNGAAAAFTFTTQKTGVHTTVEPYKGPALAPAPAGP